MKKGAGAMFKKLIIGGIALFLAFLMGVPVWAAVVLFAILAAIKGGTRFVQRIKEKQG